MLYVLLLVMVCYKFEVLHRNCRFHFASNMRIACRVLRKNFLWVELYGNRTASNTLESGSCGHFA